MSSATRPVARSSMIPAEVVGHVGEQHVLRDPPHTASRSRPAARRPRVPRSCPVAGCLPAPVSQPPFPYPAPTAQLRNRRPFRSAAGQWLGQERYAPDRRTSMSRSAAGAGPLSSASARSSTCGFQTGKLNQGQRLGALQRTQQLAQLIAGLVGTTCEEEQAAPPSETTHHIVQEREVPRSAQCTSSIRIATGTRLDARSISTRTASNIRVRSSPGSPSATSGGTRSHRKSRAKSDRPSTSAASATRGPAPPR